MISSKMATLTSVFLGLVGTQVHSSLDDPCATLIQATSKKPEHLGNEMALPVTGVVGADWGMKIGLLNLK